jgi:hypothetical protein
MCVNMLPQDGGGGAGGSSNQRAPTTQTALLCGDSPLPATPALAASEACVEQPAAPRSPQQLQNGMLHVAGACGTEPAPAEQPAAPGGGAALTAQQEPGAGGAPLQLLEARLQAQLQAKSGGSPESGSPASAGSGARRARAQGGAGKDAPPASWRSDSTFMINFFKVGRWGGGWVGVQVGCGVVGLRAGSCALLPARSRPFGRG